MDSLKTFDDAVELARDLYDHCKEESENNSPDDSETEETTEGGDGDTGDSGEMSSDMPIEFDDSEDSDVFCSFIGFKLSLEYSDFFK